MPNHGPLAEHATWRDCWLHCVCGEWSELEGGTHAEHVLAAAGNPDHIDPAELAEKVRGKELMCEGCGSTHWACLTKFPIDRCCDHCEHPETDPAGT